MGYNYSVKGIHTQLIPNVEYFQGLKNVPVEFDTYIADSIYTDTLIKGCNQARNIMTFKFSIDYPIYTDNSGASLLEIKGDLFEYNHVGKTGAYKKEALDKYYSGVTLMGRPSSKAPWFTLQIKYDQKNGTFLGFLNLSFALNNSSNKSS
jgi:hypothetical protein